MPRKIMKIGGVFLFFLLCLVIVNGFFRENRLLLEERNNWREKAVLLAERLDRLEAAEGLSPLGAIEGNTGVRELSLQRLEAVSLVFLPENRVNYTFSVIIKNNPPGGLSRPVASYSCLPWRPGAGGRTDWRRVELPALAAGEVREILVNGELSVEGGEELTAYFDLPGYTAKPAKVQVPLEEGSGLASLVPGF